MLIRKSEGYFEMNGITVAFDTSIWPEEFKSSENIEKFYTEQCLKLANMLLEKRLEFSLLE